MPSQVGSPVDFGYSKRAVQPQHKSFLTRLGQDKCENEAFFERHLQLKKRFAYGWFSKNAEDTDVFYSTESITPPNGECIQTLVHHAVSAETERVIAIKDRENFGLIGVWDSSLCHYWLYRDVYDMIWDFCNSVTSCEIDEEETENMKKQILAQPAGPVHCYVGPSGGGKSFTSKKSNILECSTDTFRGFINVTLGESDEPVPVRGLIRDIAHRANKIAPDIGGKLVWTAVCRDMTKKANFDEIVRNAAIPCMQLATTNSRTVSTVALSFHPQHPLAKSVKDLRVTFVWRPLDECVRVANERAHGDRWHGGVMNAGKFVTQSLEDAKSTLTKTKDIEVLGDNVVPLPPLIPDGKLDNSAPFLRSFQGKLAQECEFYSGCAVYVFAPEDGEKEWTPYRIKNLPDAVPGRAAVILANCVLPLFTGQGALRD